MTPAFVAHPSRFIAPSHAMAVRKTAGEAELLRQLHADQVRLIHEQGWLNMYVPKKFGGLELPLPEILRIEEGLAWVDGSLAWVVTLCSGAAWFIGFLHPEVAWEIFKVEKVCFAGSGSVGGTAAITHDGYELNGAWKYASGLPQATVFTANCKIIRNGMPSYNHNGTEEVKAFVLKRDEVTCRETWNSMGMIATASHSFEVSHLKVPATRSFTIAPASAVLSHPVYQYPFLQLAETTLAVNLSGMATRFMDLAEILSSHNKVAADILKRLKQQLEEARRDFYLAADRSWKACVTQRFVPDTMLAEVSGKSRALVRISRTLVDEVYPYCGLRAADTSEEINRVWRNFHTATQHALFNRM